jgi:sucrose-6-phosphate hydrolase SacC (GH32 family)
LRGDHWRFSTVRLTDTGDVLKNARGGALEIEAEFEPSDARAFGLKVRRAEDGQKAITIAFSGNELEVAGLKAPCKLLPNEKTLKLHVFLDKSVLEVFANNRACITRVINAGEKDLGVEVFATGGSATAKSINVWQIRSIW